MKKKYGRFLSRRALLIGGAAAAFGGVYFAFDDEAEAAIETTRNVTVGQEYQGGVEFGFGTNVFDSVEWLDDGRLEVNFTGSGGMQEFALYGPDSVSIDDAIDSADVPFRGGTVTLNGVAGAPAGTKEGTWELVGFDLDQVDYESGIPDAEDAVAASAQFDVFHDISIESVELVDDGQLELELVNDGMAPGRIDLIEVENGEAVISDGVVSAGGEATVRTEESPFDVGDNCVKIPPETEVRVLATPRSTNPASTLLDTEYDETEEICTTSLRL